jgi:DNA-binding MarR family transcriptional regulator
MPSNDLRYLRVNARSVVVKVPNVKPLPGEPVTFTYAAHGGRDEAITKAQALRDVFLDRAAAPLPSHAVTQIASDIPESVRQAIVELYALSKEQPMTLTTLVLLAYCVQQPSVSVVGLVEQTGISRSLLGSNFYGVLLKAGMVEKLACNPDNEDVYPAMYQATPKARRFLKDYQQCLNSICIEADASFGTSRSIDPTFIASIRDSAGSISTVSLPILACLSCGIVKLWDMQRMLEIHVSTISRHVQRMNTSGLVDRIEKPLSGRPYSVINESGQYVLAQIHGALAFLSE